MSQPLYDIARELTELQELATGVGEADETLQLALRDTLEAVQMGFEDKAANVVHVMKNVTSNLAAIDQEIKRLKAKKKTIKNKESSFRNYLKENMIITGINKIECPLFRITLGKAPQVLEIESLEKLPNDLITVETVIIPDKKAIKARLEDGKKVPGANMVPGTRALTIK